MDGLCSVLSHTYIGNGCNIRKSNIGRDCSIANNVSIGQEKHDLSRVSTRSIFSDEPYNQPIGGICEIDDDFWIGVYPIVLRGVRVGRGTVIGANSVVTRDVPAYGVLVGSPAKVLKWRFDQSTIEKISESRCWEVEPDEAKWKILKLDIG